MIQSRFTFKNFRLTRFYLICKNARNRHLINNGRSKIFPVHEMKSIVLFAILAAVVFAGKLPDDFKVCKIGIPDYNECLKDAFYSALVQLENGMPEINSPPLNPVEIPSAVIESGQHVLTFNDLKLYNITKFVIKDIKSTATPEIFEVKMEIFNEDVTGICDYTLTGKLMLFAVDGGGKAVISLKNITLLLDGKGVAVQGKEFMHYELTEFNFILKATSGVYQLDNVIKDNPELSKAVNEAINENWEVFLEELQPVLQNIMGKYLIAYANNVFKYVPNVSV